MNHVLHRTPQHRASRHEAVLEDRIAPEDLSVPFRQNHRHSHALESSHASTLDLAADSGILYPFCTPQPDPLDTEQNPQQQDHQKLYGQKPLGHSLEHHTKQRYKDADKPQDPCGDHHPIFSFHAAFSFADSRFSATAIFKSL